MLARRRVPEQGIDLKANRHPSRTTDPGKFNRSHKATYSRTVCRPAFSFFSAFSLYPFPDNLSIKKVCFYGGCFLWRKIIGNRRSRKSLLSASILFRVTEYALARQPN